MCWRDENERYNDGKAFKLVCRDMDGVIVTLIADNYFGYSKKEIKSQISYATNLYGDSEEEHAGGALAFPRYNLGDIFIPQPEDFTPEQNFITACQRLRSRLEVQEAGYAIDRHDPSLIYLPENAQIELPSLRIFWSRSGKTHALPLRAGHDYIYPNGFNVSLERHPKAPSWRLVGTRAEGTFCHKPSTVSGGGKSEIAKPVTGALLSGSIYVDDFEHDMAQVKAIMTYDYSNRFLDPANNGLDSRSLLSTERSLGSVIKLLTPSASTYNAGYNQWLAAIPHHILAMVLIIKRFYRPEWGDDWPGQFSVDWVNGYLGHELKFQGRKLIASYLRVGFDSQNAWRVFKLRQDYVPARKIQLEDDISASTVVPVTMLPGVNGVPQDYSVKLVENCELSFFQRPDDAVHRGSDLQTEDDLAGDHNFISNFQPLTNQDARTLIDDIIHFEQFSPPMHELIKQASELPGGAYFVSSAHPRLVDGQPSKNVRYLQTRPDLISNRAHYLAEQSARLARGLSDAEPVYLPVHAVLPGRRNNPQDLAAGIRPLAVYNPIHYQELPELFMDLICSLTGKSPSTTGAGSEGALTKGPFNALSATADLNTALVSFILCGHHGFTSAAGFIGGERRVDHDISMIIPELWSRLPVAERDPKRMIEQGFLEKLDDFEYQGRNIPACRLGYRITERFVHANFGKIFDYPTAVLDQAMLKPETQDLAAFVDGVENIHQAQRKAAELYFLDGSIEDACPPLKVLLHIMAYDHYQGKTLDDAELRALFDRDTVLNSDWYRQRLAIKRQRDLALWRRHQSQIEYWLSRDQAGEAEYRAALEAKRLQAEVRIAELSAPDYPATRTGTLGADWIHRVGGVG